MKFQFLMRHVPILTTLAGVAVTLPAAAQERAPDPQLDSREPKKSEEPAPAVNLKIKGVGNGLQIRVQSKEEGKPATEGPAAASCSQDCELKLPAGSYTLIATQVERQEAPGADAGAVPRPPTSDSDASRHRLGHALGVGGIVAVAMGSYLAIGSLVARNGAIGAFPSGLNDFFYAGLTGIGVGAGLMIGGFSLAAANGTPSTAVEPTPAIVQRRALTDMGVSVSGTF